METLESRDVPDYSLHYDRFHPDSIEHTDQMVASTTQMIGPYLPQERSGPILDIGCGYGFALLALRGMGFECIHGLEISQQQATRARRSGLDVSICDDTVGWLKGHTSEYAVILLTDVLEHIEPKRQIELLRGICQSLRPGGRLIVQVPNANAILASRWRYIDFTHYSSFTEHSLYFVLRNAGFDQISLKAEKGLGRLSKRLWRRNVRQAWRRYLVRWCWLQVFKAEIPWEKLEDISFELNLTAVAYKNA